MSLFSALKKRVEGVVAQVNPFDNGATYNTVLQNKQPVPNQPSLTQRAIAQVNPFDGGATYQHPVAPQFHSAGFFTRYSPGNILGGIEQGVVSTVKDNLIQPAVNMVKLPADLITNQATQFSHNPYIRQAGRDQLQEHATNSFISPLAQTAVMGGTNLAANNILNNPNTSVFQKNEQIKSAINPSYGQIGFNTNDSGIRTALKGASLFAQDVATPVLLKGGRVTGEVPKPAEIASTAQKTVNPHAYALNQSYKTLQLSLDRATTKPQMQAIRQAMADNRAAYRQANEGGYIASGKNGKYVKVTDNQHLFDNAHPRDYPKIARQFMRENLRGTTVKVDKNNNIQFITAAENKYGKRGTGVPNRTFNAKMRLTPELPNAVKISKLTSGSADMKGQHGFAKHGWQYRNVEFEVGGRKFAGVVNVAKGPKGGSFYDINQIKELPTSGANAHVVRGASETSISNKSGHVNPIKGLDNLSNRGEQGFIKLPGNGAVGKNVGAKAGTPNPELSVPRGQVGKNPVSSELPNAPTSGVSPVNGSGLKHSPMPKITPPKLSLELPKSQLPQEASSSLNNTPKLRGFTESVKGSQQVSPEVQGKVSGTYIPRNTQAMANLAEKRASGNLSRATKKVNEQLAAKTGTISDQTVADAIAVAKAHDANGNFDAAQQIYDRLAEHGTKGGQQIQAFSLLRNRTPQGMKFQAIRALKKAGIELDNAGQKELQGLVNGVKNTTIGTPERDMAIHQLVQFVNERIPSSFGDKLVNFWRAGLLTSPVTTGGNILGNTTELATRNLVTNPIAAGADKLMSLVTGQRTKTLAGGQLSGAKTGVGKAKVYLKTGFDERNPMQKFDAKQVNYKNKAINSYVNGVYRWMGGQDQPFYYAAKEQATKDLAKADAINLGLRGDKRAAYINDAIKNPDWKPQSFKTKSDAMSAGKYAVFQNETKLGQAAAQGSKHLGPIGQFVLPFKQVPASIAMRILDRTPAGIVKEVVTQAKAVADGKPFDQRAMAEAIGNGSFGPMVIAAGYAIAKTGNISGNYPTDPKERALWKSEGKQANSVKIGNRWYSLNYMQPFGTLLGIGAQVQKDVSSGKTPQEAWGTAGATAAKSIESQSFLQGLNGVLSAVNDPQRSMNQYITSTSSSLVPNAIRTTARATDKYQRDTRGAVQGVVSAIPGARETLPARQDMFGQPLPGYDNTANQLTNPLRPSRVQNANEPVIKELRRLQDGGNGIIPTQYNSTAFSSDKYGNTKLNPNQVRQLQSQFGSALKPVWSQLMSDSRYRQLSDEQKNTALKSAMDTVSEAVKRQFAVANNIPLNKAASSKVTAYLNGQMPDFVGSASAGTTIASGLPKEHVDVLAKYYAMSTTDRAKWFNNQNDAEYKYDLAKYQNDKLNGALTTAQDINAQYSLAKEKVGSKFSKNIRDLYGLSKTKLYNYLSNAKNGHELASNLIAYDNALLNAGVISKAKFAYGIAPSRGGRGGSKKFNALKVSTPARIDKSPKVKLSKPSGQLAKKPGIKISKSSKKQVRIGGGKIKNVL